MSKPEQELLAKYLLQQLISKDPDPAIDPIVARLARQAGILDIRQKYKRNQLLTN